MNEINLLQYNSEENTEQTTEKLKRKCRYMWSKMCYRVRKM